MSGYGAAQKSCLRWRSPSAGRFSADRIAATVLLAGGFVLTMGFATEARGGETPAEIHSMEVLSPVYEADRRYPSMTGPTAGQYLELLEAETPELLWITGYEGRVVTPEADRLMSQEYMCHSNLDMDSSRHSTLFPGTGPHSSRLFTLSQGEVSIDFPPGFGIPMMSNEQLSLNTQLLNLNWDGETRKVRHRVTVRFVRDSETEVPMQPLYPGAAYGLALLEGVNAYFGLAETPDLERHGPGCLMAENASEHEYRDPQGRVFTGHWVVPPGRQVNRTLVTRLMNLRYDTTVHYIAAHLHPFAESMELRDLTSGEVVFTSKAIQTEGRIGLAHVDSFSSVAGYPLFKDHEYELVTVYNNTSDENQDAMAVMYLYLLDKTVDLERVRATLEAERSAEPAVGVPVGVAGVDEGG